MNATTGITNVVLAGVGGQGIIRTSDILVEAAFRAGHDVKKSEIHGLSQRGGSVHGHVRFGDEIHTPVIMEGEAHFLLALEELESLRHAHFVRPDGLILVNDFSLFPAIVSQQKAKYPEDIDGKLSEYARTVRVPAAAMATELGDVRCANVILLGALARHLQIAQELWEEVIAATFPKAADLNVRAFGMGFRRSETVQAT